MSILLAAFAGMSAAPDVTPNAVNWGNITGATSGSNANQTLSGTSLSITVSLSLSAPGSFEYSLAGGAFEAYVAPFVVDSVTGQTLRWQCSTDPGIPISGTATVTNDTDAGATLDTFTFNLTG